MNNIGLLTKVKFLHSRLQPVAKALDKLQSDTTSKADVCEEWFSLLKKASLQPHLAVITKKFHRQ